MSEQKNGEDSCCGGCGCSGNDAAHFSNISNNGPAESTEKNKTSEAELLTEIEQLKKDYLYLRAEFDNHRKHAIKERSDLMKYGSEKIIVDLLGVIDNFERALETKVSSNNLDTYVKGVEMTAQELKALLQKFGVSEVPAANVEFNPNLFEALGAEETNEIPAGHVLRVFKKPYKLYDKLIRPGQVVVAKTPSPK